MKRTVPLLLDALALLALAFWLGGLACFWLALAPAASTVPAEAQPILQKVLAETLRRLGGGIEICGLVMAGVHWILRRRYQQDRRLFVADGVRNLLLFVALFAAEYGRYVLIPALLKTGAHPILSTLFALSLLEAAALIGIVGLSAWLQAARVLPAPGIATGSPEVKKPGAAPLRRRPGKTK